MTREQIRAELTDRQALIATLYGECRNEPIEAQIAVGCVIRNRVRADLHGDGKPDWWGEGFRDVCLKKSQFSCFWETNTNSQRVYDLALAMVTQAVVPDRGLVAELRWIADGLIDGHLLDRVGGATHYITSALYRIAPPAWAKGRVPAYRFGSHVFFTDIP